MAMVTVNVGLPDMDGGEVVARLRNLTDAPIQMITAHASNGMSLNSGLEPRLIHPAPAERGCLYISSDGPQPWNWDTLGRTKQPFGRNFNVNQ